VTTISLVPGDDSDSVSMGSGYDDPLGDVETMIDDKNVWGVGLQNGFHP
jgi:hypothetical protein